MRNTHELSELAREFDRLHLETYKSRRRLYNGEKLIHETTWQRILEFLRLTKTSPQVYFMTLFRWRQERGHDKNDIGVAWYGSDQAFGVYTRNVTRAFDSGNLASEREKAVAAVQTGLRVVLTGWKIHKCGIVTRRLLVAQIPVTFFAVDVFYPKVEPFLPQHVKEAVAKEKLRLTANPSILKAATEAYYDWQRFAS